MFSPLPIRSFESPPRRCQVVFYAAVFRAFDMAKSRTQEAIQSMQKGQLVLLGKNDPWHRVWKILSRSGKGES